MSGLRRRWRGAAAGALARLTIKCSFACGCCCWPECCVPARDCLFFFFSSSFLTFYWRKYYYHYPTIHHPLKAVSSKGQLFSFLHLYSLWVFRVDEHHSNFSSSVTLRSEKTMQGRRKNYRLKQTQRMDEAEKNPTDCLQTPTLLTECEVWLCVWSVLRENCVWSEMTMEIYFYSVDDC